jgi:hypothetical protein
MTSIYRSNSGASWRLVEGWRPRAVELIGWELQKPLSEAE